MAKNNFKKKKTLKRSLRRNHTKKVASASLGSRTLNIRKKNRRSQKQRATLRNKRNARAKVGGGWLFGPSKEQIKEEEQRKQKIIAKAEKLRIAREQYLSNIDLADARQKEQEEEMKNTERKQSNNYYAILPTLEDISAKMRNVKDYKEERVLFEAAEKLILSNGLPKGLSPSDIQYARNQVLEARNTAAKILKWPQMRDWYFTYEYGGTQRTDMYKYYENPPEIIQETEDKINPQQLSVHSGEASNEPLTVVDSTSNPSNPPSLFSVTPRPISSIKR